MKQDTSNHMVCKYGHHHRPVTNYVVCTRLKQLWGVCSECKGYTDQLTEYGTFNTLEEAEEALLHFKMFGEEL